MEECRTRTISPAFMRTIADIMEEFNDITFYFSEEEDCYCDKKTRAIYLSEDFFMMEPQDCLFYLFHEIGHFQIDEENLSSVEQVYQATKWAVETIFTDRVGLLDSVLDVPNHDFRITPGRFLFDMDTRIKIFSGYDLEEIDPEEVSDPDIFTLYFSYEEEYLLKICEEQNEGETESVKLN